MNARDQYMAYMRGWRDGAALKAMRTDLDGATESYATGYKHGRTANSRAQAYAAIRYDYDQVIVKLQENP